jgi:hypothetical protein
MRHFLDEVRRTRLARAEHEAEWNGRAARNMRDAGAGRAAVDYQRKAAVAASEAVRLRLALLPG